MSTASAARVMHPSPRCVAELRTTRADGSLGVASGYLVAPGWVLTAAHVVSDAVSVRVWVDPQAMVTVERESLVDVARIKQFPVEGSDWALVLVSGQPPPAGFAPVVFGDLDRESVESVPVVALGLPRFRIRDRPPGSGGPAAPSEVSALVREVVAAGGQLIPAGGQKTGVLTMTVVGAPDTYLQTGRVGAGSGSVWEGMSGAAVWAGGVLVGVVVRHELEEGAASLTVRPVPDQTQVTVKRPRFDAAPV